MLPELAKEGRQFDMVFVDADLETQLEQFDWAVKLTRPGGCVPLDDVIASIFKKGYEQEGSESIITQIGKDERVTPTLMPTVACHPAIPTPVYNGFIMALVK